MADAWFFVCVKIHLQSSSTELAIRVPSLAMFCRCKRMNTGRLTRSCCSMWRMCCSTGGHHLAQPLLARPGQTMHVLLGHVMHMLCIVHPVQKCFAEVGAVYHIHRVWLWKQVLCVIQSMVTEVGAGVHSPATRSPFSPVCLPATWHGHRMWVENVSG